MAGWYARALVHVADVERSLQFYLGKLGFAEAWRHAGEDRLLVAQVDREGCELILSCQWPEHVGHGIVFVSLAPEAFAPVRTELADKGVAVKDGWWGYELMIVEDLDGNQLFFPAPGKN